VEATLWVFLIDLGIFLVEIMVFFCFRTQRGDELLNDKNAKHMVKLTFDEEDLTNGSMYQRLEQRISRTLMPVKERKIEEKPQFKLISAPSAIYDEANSDDRKFNGINEPMLRSRPISDNQLTRMPHNRPETEREQDGLEAEVGRNGFIDPTTVQRGRSNSHRNRMLRQSK
jgi:hypothetical protein